MAGAARKCRARPQLLPCCADGCTACKRCVESRCTSTPALPGAAAQVGIQEPPRLFAQWAHSSMRDPRILSRQPPKLVLIRQYGHAVSLRFCRPVIPSSCQIVQTRHPKTTSCQHKLVTTHQLSVECPCTPPKTHSCPEKPHQCARGHESIINAQSSFSDCQRC